MILDFGNGFRAGTHHSERMNGVQGAITGHSGAEFPEVEVRGLEATLRDGGTIFGSRAPMRRISFAVDFRGVTRRELARAFAPGSRMTLARVTPAGGVLQGETVECSIPCVLDSVSFRDENLNTTSLALSFVSERAYPIGPSELIAGTVTVGDGLEYPYSYAYEYDSYEADDTLSFWSHTEVDAEPVVRFVVGLAASDLTLTLNGSFTIDAELDAGDVVVVDSANRTVTINGVNALEAISEQSAWPLVVPGNNTLTASSLGMLSVSYDPRLVGIL